MRQQQQHIEKFSRLVWKSFRPPQVGHYPICSSSSLRVVRFSPLREKLPNIVQHVWSSGELSVFQRCPAQSYATSDERRNHNITRQRGGEILGESLVMKTWFPFWN
mmetsp:Transcript_10631/g.21398  ORF Transcript_10631/g.21398 Transcript_10631/m.21398 type:complete len:106 (+) Transcript_10631:816-1133(+)